MYVAHRPLTPTQLSVIRESEQPFLIGVGVHAHASWEVNSNQAWKTDQLPAVLTELVHSKSEFLVNRLLRMIFAAMTNLEMRVTERLSALPYSLFIVCDRRQSLDKRIHVAKQFCYALDCCVPRGAASSIKAHCQ